MLTTRVSSRSGTARGDQGDQGDQNLLEGSRGVGEDERRPIAALDI